MQETPSSAGLAGPSGQQQFQAATLTGRPSLSPVGPGAIMGASGTPRYTSTPENAGIAMQAFSNTMRPASVQLGQSSSGAHFQGQLGPAPGAALNTAMSAAAAAGVGHSTPPELPADLPDECYPLRRLALARAGSAPSAALNRSMPTTAANTAAVAITEPAASAAPGQLPAASQAQSFALSQMLRPVLQRHGHPAQLPGSFDMVLSAQGGICSAAAATTEAASAVPINTAADADSRTAAAVPPMPATVPVSGTVSKQPLQLFMPPAATATHPPRAVAHAPRPVLQPLHVQPPATQHTHTQPAQFTRTISTEALNHHFQLYQTFTSQPHLLTQFLQSAEGARALGPNVAAMGGSVSMQANGNCSTNVPAGAGAGAESTDEVEALQAHYRIMHEQQQAALMAQRAQRVQYALYVPETQHAQHAQHAPAGTQSLGQLPPTMAPPTAPIASMLAARAGRAAAAAAPGIGSSNPAVAAVPPMGGPDTATDAPQRGGHVIGGGGGGGPGLKPDPAASHMVAGWGHALSEDLRLSMCMQSLLGQPAGHVPAGHIPGTEGEAGDAGVDASGPRRSARRVRSLFSTDQEMRLNAHLHGEMHQIDVTNAGGGGGGGGGADMPPAAPPHAPVRHTASQAQHTAAAAAAGRGGGVGTIAASEGPPSPFGTTGFAAAALASQLASLQSPRTLGAATTLTQLRNMRLGAQQVAAQQAAAQKRGAQGGGQPRPRTLTHQAPGAGAAPVAGSALGAGVHSMRRAHSEELPAALRAGTTAMAAGNKAHSKQFAMALDAAVGHAAPAAGLPRLPYQPPAVHAVQMQAHGQQLQPSVPIALAPSRAVRTAHTSPLKPTDAILGNAGGSHPPNLQLASGGASGKPKQTTATVKIEPTVPPTNSPSKPPDPGAAVQKQPIVSPGMGLSSAQSGKQQQVTNKGAAAPTATAATAAATFFSPPTSGLSDPRPTAGHAAGAVTIEPAKPVTKQTGKRKDSEAAPSKPPAAATAAGCAGMKPKTGMPSTAAKPVANPGQRPLAKQTRAAADAVAGKTHGSVRPGPSQHPSQPPAGNAGNAKNVKPVPAGKGGAPKATPAAAPGAAAAPRGAVRPQRAPTAAATVAASGSKARVPVVTPPANAAAAERATQLADALSEGSCTPLYSRPLTAAQLARGKVYIGVEESKVFAKHLAIPWGVAGQREVRACKEDGSAVPNVFLSCVCGREIDHRLGGLRPFIQGCKAEVQWVLQVWPAPERTLLLRILKPNAISAQAKPPALIISSRASAQAGPQGTQAKAAAGSATAAAAASGSETETDAELALDREEAAAVKKVKREQTDAGARVQKAAAVGSDLGGGRVAAAGAKRSRPQQAQQRVLEQGTAPTHISAAAAAAAAAGASGGTSGGDQVQRPSGQASKRRRSSSVPKAVTEEPAAPTADAPDAMAHGMTLGFRMEAQDSDQDLPMLDAVQMDADACMEDVDVGDASMHGLMLPPGIPRQLAAQGAGDRGAAAPAPAAGADPWVTDHKLGRSVSERQAVAAASNLADLAMGSLLQSQPPSHPLNLPSHALLAATATAGRPASTPLGAATAQRRLLFRRDVQSSHLRRVQLSSSLAWTLLNHIQAQANATNLDLNVLHVPSYKTYTISLKCVLEQSRGGLPRWQLGGLGRLLREHGAVEIGSEMAMWIAPNGGLEMETAPAATGVCGSMGGMGFGTGIGNGHSLAAVHAESEAEEQEEETMLGGMGIGLTHGSGGMPGMPNALYEGARGRGGGLGAGTCSRGAGSLHGSPRNTLPFPKTEPSSRTPARSRSSAGSGSGKACGRGVPRQLGAAGSDGVGSIHGAAAGMVGVMGGGGGHGSSPRGGMRPMASPMRMQVSLPPLVMPPLPPRGPSAASVEAAGLLASVAALAAATRGPGRAASEFDSTGASGMGGLLTGLPFATSVPHIALGGLGSLTGLGAMSHGMHAVALGPCAAALAPLPVLPPASSGAEASLRSDEQAREDVRQLHEAVSAGTGVFGLEEGKEESESDGDVLEECGLGQAGLAGSWLPEEGSLPL